MQGLRKSPILGSKLYECGFIPIYGKVSQITTSKNENEIVAYRECKNQYFLTKYNSTEC